jgi:hypothetical protein
MFEKWKVGEGPVTHFLMDGGILRVDNQNSFDRDYLQVLLEQKKVCVVEKRTEHFKFFIDFDYKADHELSSSKVIDLAIGISKLIGGKCYIARTAIRKVGENIKTGIHLHFPHKIVTKQEAMKLRNQIILAFPEYADSIDESVYIGSGLRLIWSYKYHHGEYIAPYMPWKSVTTSGTIEHMNTEPYLDTIRLFSIRIPDIGEPPAVESRDTGKLEDYINKYMPGQQNAKIQKIQKSSTGESLVAQTDSKYCTRINKEHRRNHIWFWIKNGTIRQMCFDPDCKDYKGKEYALPLSVLKNCEE